MGVALALAALLLAPLLWLALCPLVLRCVGNAGTVHPSRGLLSVHWWPLELSVEGRDGGARLRTRLFGLTVWRGAPGEAAPARDRSRRSKQKPEEPAPKRTARFPAGLASRDAALRVARFVVAQRRQFRLDRLRGHLQFGFEEPADTGIADGFLWSLRGTHPAATRAFSHDCDWSGELCLDARGELQVRAYLGRIALATLALAFSLWRSARRTTPATQAAA